MGGIVGTILLAVVAVPLLVIVEIILLVLCGIRWLPPLCCMFEKTPFKGTFDASKIPAHPALSEELLKKTEVIEDRGMKWYQGTGSAAQAVKTICELMLNYTVVSTTRTVPEVMTGVFWMDGNKVPEELACIAYADVEEKEGRYCVNKVNSTVSWTYLNTGMGKFIANFQEKDETSGMQVFSFEGPECKDGRIWSCTSFNYEDVNWLTSIGKFSMERLPGPGVNYKRGCYWFHKVFGNCLEFGSYTLKKIMTIDGAPVQPAYDEFVKKMQTTNQGVRQMTECPPPEGENTPLI